MNILRSCVKINAETGPGLVYSRSDSGEALEDLNCVINTIQPKQAVYALVNIVEKIFFSDKKLFITRKLTRDIEAGMISKVVQTGSDRKSSTKRAFDKAMVYQTSDMHHRNEINVLIIVETGNKPVFGNLSLDIFVCTYSLCMRTTPKE